MRQPHLPIALPGITVSESGEVNTGELICRVEDHGDVHN